jgi:hypothetical protein
MGVGRKEAWKAVQPSAHPYGTDLQMQNNHKNALKSLRCVACSLDREATKITCNREKRRIHTPPSMQPVDAEYDPFIKAQVLPVLSHPLRLPIQKVLAFNF